MTTHEKTAANASAAPQNASKAEMLSKIEKADIGSDHIDTDADKRIREFLLVELRKVQDKYSPEAFGKHVSSLLKILEKCCSDKSIIEAEAKAKIREMQNSVEPKESVVGKLMTELRDHTAGNFRWPTKKRLEAIGNLSSADYEKFVQELERNPDTLEKFLLGWQNDLNWKTYVLKNYPESHRKLNDLFSKECQRLGINAVDSNIQKQIEKVNRSEESLRKTKEAFGIQQTQLSALVSKLDACTKDPKRYEKDLVGNKAQILALQAGIHGLGKEAGKLADSAAKNDLVQKIQALEHAIRTVQELPEYDIMVQAKAAAKAIAENDPDYEKRFWQGIEAKMTVAKDALAGKVSFQSVTKESGAAVNKTESLAEIELEFKNKVQSGNEKNINSEKFAKYLTFLEKSGKLTYQYFVQTLTAPFLEKFAILWQINSDSGKLTGAQKILLEKGNGHIKTAFEHILKTQFEHSARALQLKEGHGYPNTKDYLEKKYPGKSQEIIKILSSKKDLTENLVKILAVYSASAESVQTDLREISIRIQNDSCMQKDDQKIRNVTEAFNETTPIKRVISKTITAGELHGLKLTPQERELLNSERSFKELEKDIQSLKQARSLLEKIKKTKLSPAEASALKGIEDYLQKSVRTDQAKAIATDNRDGQLAQKAISTAAVWVKKEIREKEKKTGRKLSDQNIDTIIQKSENVALARAVVEQAGETAAAVRLSSPNQELDLYHYDAARYPAQSEFSGTGSVSATNDNSDSYGVTEWERSDRHRGDSREKKDLSDTPANRRKNTDDFEDRSGASEKRANYLENRAKFMESGSFSELRDVRYAYRPEPFVSSNTLTEMLEKKKPVVLGACILVPERNGNIAVVSEHSKFSIDSAKSNIAVVIASIAEKMNIPDLIGTIPEIVQQSGNNELCNRLKDGISKKEEAEMIGLVARAFGLKVDFDPSSTDPNHLIRTISTNCAVLPGSPSLLEVARRNDHDLSANERIIRSDGTVIATNFVKKLLTPPRFSL